MIGDRFDNPATSGSSDGMSNLIQYRGYDLIPYALGVAVWLGDHLLFCAPSVEDAKERLDRALMEEAGRPPARSGNRRRDQRSS